MAQILQATSSLPAKPPPKTSESKAPSQEKRAGGVSKENLEASTKEGLDAAVKEIQASLQQLPVDVKYGVDRETGMYYFKLIDPATQEVIRQVPSEEIMAMSKRLRDLSDGQGTSGVLMDKEG